MYCSNCGADLLEGAYCSECGDPVSGGESPDISPRPQQAMSAQRTDVRHRPAPSVAGRGNPFSTGQKALAVIGIGFILLVIGAVVIGFPHGSVARDGNEGQRVVPGQTSTFLTPIPSAHGVTQPILPVVDENPVTAVDVPPTLVPAPPPTVPPPPPQAAPTTLTFDEWINAVLIIDQEQNAERGRWLSAYERGDSQAAQRENSIRIGTPSRLQVLSPPPCAASAHVQFLAAAEDWAESSLFLATWIPAATYSADDERELQRATDLVASGDAKYDVYRAMLQTTCV